MGGEWSHATSRIRRTAVVCALLRPAPRRSKSRAARHPLAPCRRKRCQIPAPPTGRRAASRNLFAPDVARPREVVLRVMASLPRAPVAVPPASAVPTAPEGFPVPSGPTARSPVHDTGYRTQVHAQSWWGKDMSAATPLNKPTSPAGHGSPVRITADKSADIAFRGFFLHRNGHRAALPRPVRRAPARPVTASEESVLRMPHAVAGAGAAAPATAAAAGGRAARRCPQHVAFPYATACRAGQWRGCPQTGARAARIVYVAGWCPSPCGPGCPSTPGPRGDGPPTATGFAR
ncbi:hypothetical protein STBA_00350 [Streptomyces sp. MP131-18]|nr:hypothetical protein STBA_00350 [Streptomyces sp. MP131-18]